MKRKNPHVGKKLEPQEHGKVVREATDPWGRATVDQGFAKVDGVLNKQAEQVYQYLGGIGEGDAEQNVKTQLEQAMEKSIKKAKEALTVGDTEGVGKAIDAIEGLWEAGRMLQRYDSDQMRVDRALERVVRDGNLTAVNHHTAAFKKAMDAKKGQQGPR